MEVFNNGSVIQIPTGLWGGSVSSQKDEVALISAAVQKLRDQKMGPDNAINVGRMLIVSRAAVSRALDDAVQNQFNRSPDERLATFIKRYGNFLAMAMTISNRETDLLILYVFMVHGQLVHGQRVPTINLRVQVVLRSDSKTKKSYEKTFGAPPELLNVGNMGFPAVIIDLNAELLLDGAVFADVAA